MALAGCWSETWWALSFISRQGKPGVLHFQELHKQFWKWNLQQPAHHSPYPCGACRCLLTTSWELGGGGGCRDKDACFCHSELSTGGVFAVPLIYRVQPSKAIHTTQAISEQSPPLFNKQVVAVEQKHTQDLHYFYQLLGLHREFPTSWVRRFTSQFSLLHWGTMVPY